MQCELCGGFTLEAFRVMVEGSTVVACEDCTRLGKVIEKITKKKPEKPVLKEKPEPNKVFEVADELELSEDFAEKIKKAREKVGIKQEDLAKAIAEPAPLIRRIESGRLAPSPVVARKIERKLGIRLYEESVAREVFSIGKPIKGEVTLGDVVVLRRKKG